MSAQDIFGLVFGLAFAVFIVSAGVCIYFTTNMTLNRKPGVPYFPIGGGKPTSISPNDLTNEGAVARRNSLTSLSIAVGALALTAVCSILRIWLK
jgi:hypothetical protein